MTAVAKLTGESDKTIYRILDYFVNKARAEENWSSVKNIGVDETSSRKGHNYISTFVDIDKVKVLSITKGKDNSVIKALIKDFEAHKGKRENIKNVCADLSQAFRKGIKNELPDVIITSDRFHIMQLVARAQDKVRLREYKTQKQMKNLRYALLSNPENQTEKQKQIIEVLKEILQYFKSRMTSGAVEGLNTIIQLLKRRARGFGNTEHFMTMIYLKCGKLKFNLPSVMSYLL